MLSEDESVSDPVEMADTGRDMVLDREASELTDASLWSFSLWTSTVYFGLRDMLRMFVVGVEGFKDDAVACTGVCWCLACLVFWAKTEETERWYVEGDTGALYARELVRLASQLSYQVYLMQVQAVKPA